MPPCRHRETGGARAPEGREARRRGVLQDATPDSHLIDSNRACGLPRDANLSGERASDTAEAWGGYEPALDSTAHGNAMGTEMRCEHAP